MISLVEYENRIDGYIEDNSSREGVYFILKQQCLMDEVLVTKEDEIRYLKANYKFFKYFKDWINLIEVSKVLVYTYMDMGLEQITYRTLVETIDIAEEYEIREEIFNLHKLEFEALSKFEDIVNAEKSFNKLIEIADYFQIEINEQTKINYGCLLQRYDRLDEAITVLEDIQQSTGDDIFFHAHLNLAICFRKKGWLAKAISSLKLIQKCNYSDIDALIEYELVFTKTLIASKDYNNAQNHLIKAVNLLDDYMVTIVKLHYRRAFREMYIVRLEGLLLSIPSEELNCCALYVVAFTRSNQTSDWLYILEWIENIIDKNIIDSSEKSALLKSLDSVASNGAPFLYGMLEKYDDHHEINIDVWRWDGLIEVVQRVTKKYKLAPILNQARSEFIVGTLKNRLENKMLIVGYMTYWNKILVILRDRFEFIDLDEIKKQEFFRVFYSYKKEEISNKDFAKSMSEFIDTLVVSCAKLIDYANTPKFEGVIHIPDIVGFLPINSLFLSDVKVKKKMIAGEFDLRVVPFLFPGKHLLSTEFHKTLSIVETEDLNLSKSEVENFNRILQVKDVNLLDANDLKVGEFNEKMDESDILYVSSHGAPLDFYTDAFHASLADGSPFSVINIQAKFYGMNYKLVYLSSCHSASQIMFRQSSLTDHKQNYLSPYENASISALLLLNRKSYCVASIWRTFDKFAFIFSHNVAKNLAKEVSIPQAFSIALATLHSLDYTTIKQNLEDTDFLSSQDTNINHLMQMIRHPYSYETYRLYSLL